MSPDVADVMADLAGTHPGIDLIRKGIKLLLDKPLTPETSASVLMDLASDEGKDVISLIGLIIRDLMTAPHIDWQPSPDDGGIDHVKSAVYAAETWEGRQHVQDLIADLGRRSGGDHHGH